MRLVLLGPPGAGKGTQARILETRLGVPQVASGDLLRTAVQSKSALGLKAKGFMDKGALVPDELVLPVRETFVPPITLDDDPELVEYNRMLNRLNRQGR